ncbi:sigma-70 family RNA polymerase sigma factor [Streptomonospora salina]|uniref:Uncharacterized protein n=1 Tax=Streptomonospora salina TaxID=104205 RepID=A0A841E7M5_9ACTN|nr:sigma-70 family RNA polymerase sigma factor [Streptomonospora salina]MBB5998474.1 hypothetical protein [Streptomonospora salina]
MHSAAALQVAEREFVRLVPDPLELERGDVAPPDAENPAGAVLDGARWPLDLLSARDLLLAPGTDRASKDAVWRAVIARARMSQDWMCGAVGLAMPALKAVARRCSRGLSAEGVEEVDAEILAGFLAAVRAINTDYANLAWYLRCRAQRAGLRARRNHLALVPVDDAGDETAPAAVTDRGGGGHPDAVLERAVERGVLTGAEAELIGASRLEETSLRTLAAQQEGGYWALAKRRSRAEERLLRALAAGDLAPGPAPTGANRSADATATSRLRVRAVSNPGWALAL